MTDCDADAAAAATAAAAAADFIRRPAAPGRTIDGWPKTCCISNRRKSRLASERSGETLGRDGEYSNSWERGREREREREQDRLGSASRFPIAINRFILKRATVTENRLDAISATHLFNRAPATIDYPATAKLRALPFTDARTTTCSFSDLFFCRSCCFFSSSLKHLNVASATVGSGRRTADPG